MKRIVDQNGKPFKPDTMQEILNHAPTLSLFSTSRTEELASEMRLRQLRESCGVSPATLTFRRHLPYGEKT